ncbi:hypothetical protein Acor_19390 [Acrocarpospora corrugata]|uniref:HTH tetR-type domain-containing protein n=1 Tax=Acrocarpospora corrugata TaxID=35763 RepID=A0A5M3VTG0_9ACTN|nr:hypothetical protein Acor_19390 [Acrocarpospora corrugata]
MVAAEEVFSRNPAATMEQIAEEAGVARTTIHRRFASREALLEAMEVTAWQEIGDAIDAARPYTAPPQVALHEATANVLRIKFGWRFTLTRPVPLSEQARTIQAEVMAKCAAAFTRARESGMLPSTTDLSWTQRAYLALLSEAAHGSTGQPESNPGKDQETSDDPDLLAARVLGTLLHGVTGLRD